ncbi:MAG: hypothetical protein WCA63_08560 [Gallionella sp.]
MNHDPLQWLVTRVMPCGKFGLLLALMTCKDRVNMVRILVPGHFYAVPFYASTAC